MVRGVGKAQAQKKAAKKAAKKKKSKGGKEAKADRKKALKWLVLAIKTSRAWHCKQDALML